MGGKLGTTSGLALLLAAGMAWAGGAIDGDGNRILSPSIVKDCSGCPEMVAVPAGSFLMGSNNGIGDEYPAHTVHVLRPFAIGKTEVTQDQWQAVMGYNPSAHNSCGGTCPVEYVTWNDAQEFVRKLSQKTGKQYRLPTEAEWEYAARAGAVSKYPWGDDERQACKHGNVRDRKKGITVFYFDCVDSYVRTSPVASFAPNALGLHDMIGNVWEWVEDCYNSNFKDAPTDGSAWMSQGCPKRVMRGGGWDNYLQNTNVVSRWGAHTNFRHIDIGFRIARTLSEQ